MYRRRRYYSKARKTVRRYKRRYTIRKAPKSKSAYEKVHMVKRYGIAKHGNIDITIIDNPENGMDQTYRLHFRLSAVTGYTDFTNLYDMYKIRAVKVSFIPIMNVTTATQSGFASLIYSTYDFNGDTSTLPPSRDKIREYQYCKWSPYGKIHKRYFFPRILDDQQTSSTKVGPQNWISTANPDVPYHGLFVSITNVPSIADFEKIYKVEVKYYLSFKNTK